MTILKFNAFEFRTSKKWKGGVFFIKKINIFFFNNSFPRFLPYKSLFYIKGDFKVNLLLHHNNLQRQQKFVTQDPAKLEKYDTYKISFYKC